MTFDTSFNIFLLQFSYLCTNYLYFIGLLCNLNESLKACTKSSYTLGTY